MPPKTAGRGKPCADLRCLFPEHLKIITSNFCISLHTINEAQLDKARLVPMRYWSCLNCVASLLSIRCAWQAAVLFEAEHGVGISG